MPSTVPRKSPISTYSPTRNASSSMKKMPETISRTSDCAPNPIARPTTPAPASKGPISTPSADNIVSVAITAITANKNERNTGASVDQRPWVEPPPPSPPAAWSDAAILLANVTLINCQQTNASARVSRIVPTSGSQGVFAAQPSQGVTAPDCR